MEIQHASGLFVRKNISSAPTANRRRCKHAGASAGTERLVRKYNCRSKTRMLSTRIDGDGFTNLDGAGTHRPNEQGFAPDYLTKLHLASAREPFRYMFSSWVGGTFAINAIDQSNDAILEDRRHHPRQNLRSSSMNTRAISTHKVDVSELASRHQGHQGPVTLEETVATSPNRWPPCLYLGRPSRI